MMKTETAKSFLPGHRQIDYLKILLIGLSRWYLLAGILVLALIAGHIYLRYSPKTYSTSGILKFEEKKPELSDLVKVMSSTARNPASLQSEKSIIQSRTILLAAIRRLDYDISFYTKGRFRNKELYPQKPLQINILNIGQHPTTGPSIAFQAISSKTFRLSWKEEEKQIQRTFFYNSPITIHHTRFTIGTNTALSRDTTYIFHFNKPENLLDRVSNGLQINEVLKNANVIRISQTDSNPYFAADILNAIMIAYLQYDQHQKAQSATQMIRFINGQLGLLSSVVKDAETALERHKQNSGIIDIRLSANQTLSKLSELESQRAVLNAQELNIRQLKQQVTADQEVRLNLSLEGNIDPLLGTLTSHLNSLLRDKHALLKTYHETSIPILDIDEQITAVRKAALQNINASYQRIRKNRLLLDIRISALNQVATTLAPAEKTLLSLGRNFGINEKVYSFLSEKRLETQINRAAIMPGATIVDQAQLNDIPLTPDQPKVYRTAALLGFLSGIVILVLLRIYTPYVYNQEIVQSSTNIPIAALIPKFPGNINKTLFLDQDQHRTVFAESVRALRTYLNFLATEEKSKVICITSDLSGEGKSFIALNLATAFAALHKKVILIGSDLRRPYLHTFFNTPKDCGLSSYLQDQHTIEQITQPTAYKKLDFIGSGPIPANPAELLHSAKMAVLTAELKKRYDVILLDTAPVGMVSDAIPLCASSHINLFIVRYGKSRRKTLNLPQGLADKYHLNNIVIVLNAFEKNLFHTSCYKDEPQQSTARYYTDYSNHQHSGYYEHQKN